jgi:hypothetical protein
MKNINTIYTEKWQTPFDAGEKIVFQMTQS